MPVEPTYYAFAFEIDPDFPGCGPQGRFVEVVGTQFHEVATEGCDLFADQGVIDGDQVALVGRTSLCGEEGTDFNPATQSITGGATDLRIPGEERVVGPVDSMAQLDKWYAQENERVAVPNPPNHAQITAWMTAAAADDWTSGGC